MITNWLSASHQISISRMCCSNTRTLMCSMTLNYILLYLPANTFKSNTDASRWRAHGEKGRSRKPRRCFSSVSRSSEKEKVERKRSWNREWKISSSEQVAPFTNSMMLNVIYRPGWKVFWRCRCWVGGFCAIVISPWVNPNAREKGENPSRNYSLAWESGGDFHESKC